MILGIDEVGRGPWAGPLVVGAVVLGGADIPGLTDSKKLTAKKRAAIAPLIHKQAIAVGLGWVSAQELDDIGMSAALKLATRRAVEQITVPYHEIIIDGTINLLEGTGKAPYVTTLAKADLLIPSVSAASIVAKVARDEYMAAQDEKYPGYAFGKHAGYGVAAHRAAIERLGVTPLHRLSFAPLAKYREGYVRPDEDEKPHSHDITTREIGDTSEDVATNELVRRGHEVLHRNWKTKYCEVDIVSRKNEIYYFTEVKHRRKNTWGDGFDAITGKKLNQMKFAAKFFAHTNRISENDLRLIAIATMGEEPVVEKLVILDY